MADQGLDKFSRSTLDVQYRMVRDADNEIMIVRHEAEIVVDVPTCDPEREHQCSNGGGLIPCKPQRTAMIAWYVKTAQ